MASYSSYRGYHSVAVLLPNGRVLSAGGNYSPNAEIYSPPYLFKGQRPAITSTPANVRYGQTFLIGTADSASIAKVTWIRLSSVTHAFNQNQRINFLSFAAAANGLNVRAPSDPNLCPPGHYMLFVLNGNGVPSVARIVRISSS
jgi:galactose oxidase